MRGLQFSVSLKNNYEFRRLYNKGQSAALPTLVVYARKNRRAQNRVGYTVSVKLGHAVVRNRIRRRLREIYRLHAAELCTGFDIVIVARSRCIDAEYRKMEEAFLSACGKLGLIRESGQ